MKIITSDSTEYNLIYTTHDHWLDDLSHEIRNNFQFEVNTNSFDELLRVLSSHINYWLRNASEHEPKKEKIKEGVLKLEFPYGVLEGDLFQEYLLCIDLGAIQIYGDVDRDLMGIYNSKNNTVTFRYSEEAALVFTGDEIEDEVEAEYKDDEEYDTEYYFLNSDILLFMDDFFEEYLHDFLIEKFTSLNGLYKANNYKEIKLIDMK
jgi:hypothetical protein